MSALGQKRTCAPHQRMSALPTTAKADSRKRSCLLYPRKRTCAVQLGMSALGQKQTLAKGGLCELDPVIRYEILLGLFIMSAAIASRASASHAWAISSSSLLSSGGASSAASRHC